MARFGIVTRKEYEALQGQLVQMQAQVEQQTAALKAGDVEWARWLLQTAEAEQFNLPDPSVYKNQSDLFRKLSWVLAAVDLTANAAAITEFEVMRLIANREPKDIPNHPFEMLLQRPNPLDSRYEFLYATVAMYKLNGNAYWWLNRDNENQEPLELWFIPPHMIKPIPDEQMYLRGYIYYPGNGSEIFLEPWQICHFRRFNPFSRFLGLSAVEAIALVAQGDIGMQDWNTRLFKVNNARLPGVLTFQEMIADPTWEKIKADTREAARQRELLMLRGVGPGGVNWLQNAVSQKEMEFLKGREANAKEIMDTLAPGSYTMLYESATEANSRTGRAVFNELTVYPVHVLMGEKITNGILPVYGGRPIIGRFKDIRVTDRQLELQEQAEYSKTHTLEEIREEFYGDDPLGDERDKLLPEQIKAASGGIQEQPTPFAAQPGQQPKNPTEQGMSNEMQRAANEQPMQPQEMEQASNKAALDDLSKWQRKALKKVGQAVSFESDSIPASVQTMINAKLPACKSEVAIKAAFMQAKYEIESRKPADKGEAALVLEGLRLALEGSKNGR